MSQLQNLMNTIYYQLETLSLNYADLHLVYGLPTAILNGSVLALEHDKTKVDEQNAVSGNRRRPRVFVVDVYTTNQKDRNDICEAIKDLFENKVIKVLDSNRNDTGVNMTGEGVRIEVDMTKSYKARAKIYVSTVVN